MRDVHGGKDAKFTKSLGVVEKDVTKQIAKYFGGTLMEARRIMEPPDKSMDLQGAASSDDDSDDDADDDETETETIPVVRAPNFAKAAARLNSKRDVKALGGAGVGVVGKKEKNAAVGVVVGKKEKGGAVVPTGTAKRTPETALKPGKKTASKPAKRRRA